MGSEDEADWLGSEVPGADDEADDSVAAGSGAEVAVFDAEVAVPGAEVAVSGAEVAVSGAEVAVSVSVSCLALSLREPVLLTRALQTMVSLFGLVMLSFK